jgi:hypothetical protein
MGLYLCIFDGHCELEGVEVGLYDDFGRFRDYIARKLEGGQAGARFPTLMLHDDGDGEWSVEDCSKLKSELAAMSSELKQMPPHELTPWQAELRNSLGLTPRNAYESFFDVDGKPLLGRLCALVDLAVQRSLPILFQ